MRITAASSFGSVPRTTPLLARPESTIDARTPPTDGWRAVGR
ncbi:hypothetical protein [Gordonia rubripertincta]|nr:hypothetical protein [Gordonia rubripertincta]